jgi:hypothetical protein
MIKWKLGWFLIRWDLTWESSILSHHAQVDLIAIDLIIF